jgi:DNA polymerase-3 subunit beta
MKFRVERDALADAVAWTARTLPARPPMAVLAGVLLEVGGDEADPTALTVSSFDYEVSAQASAEVSGSDGGRALVSGRLLAEITRSLPAQPVDIRIDGARLVVSCGPARFTLPTLPVEDYPTIPEMPVAAGVVGSDAFAAAVAQVAVAAGRDDTLPVLTGVRIEIDGDTLTLAATDRYRLAVRRLKWQPDAPEQTATALVPARTLADTARSLTGAEVTVALASGGVGEGLIGFTGGDRRTTTRLLDGEFPKYRSLFPTQYTATAQVATAPFIEAIKRVALVAPRNASVRLRFTTAGNVTLEAGGGEDAEAVEILECSFEAPDGEEFTVAFNPGYLLDGLGAIDSDAAHLGFTTPTKPAVVTGKESEADYSYLIMPVRLSS